MPDEARMGHDLGAFIQEVEQGRLIRRWYALEAGEVLNSMNHFLCHASALEQEQMAQSLLQVAATYPDSAVRRRLIGVYGAFQVAVARQTI